MKCFRKRVSINHDAFWVKVFFFGSILYEGGKKGSEGLNKWNLHIHFYYLLYYFLEMINKNSEMKLESAPECKEHCSIRVFLSENKRIIIVIIIITIMIVWKTPIWRRNNMINRHVSYIKYYLSNKPLPKWLFCKWSKSGSFFPFSL